MSLFNFINEAGNALNRVIQQAEEKLLNVEKTSYPDVLIMNLKTLDVLTDVTTRLIDETEAMLEPNPAVRLEGKLMEKVEKRQERSTPLEDLGNAFELSSKAVRSTCIQLSEDFSLCGKYQTKIGASAKHFQGHASDVYVSKLRKLLDYEFTKYRAQADILEEVRLDHDSLKIRVSKAITIAGKAALDEDFDKAREQFVKQLDITVEMFKDIRKYYKIHRQLLEDFVGAQSDFYRICHRDLEKLRGKVKGRPEIDLELNGECSGRPEIDLESKGECSENDDESKDTYTARPHKEDSTNGDGVSHTENLE